MPETEAVDRRSCSMIRKLSSGEYLLGASQADPDLARRRRLGLLMPRPFAAFSGRVLPVFKR